uniref:Uncharacterized protein n=1 Tax=Globodera pallida TaxID=36090 RepID=A0A183CTV7_GLOPA
MRRPLICCRGLDKAHLQEFTKKSSGSATFVKSNEFVGGEQQQQQQPLQQDSTCFYLSQQSASSSSTSPSQDSSGSEGPPARPDDLAAKPEEVTGRVSG